MPNMSMLNAQTMIDAVPLPAALIGPEQRITHTNSAFSAIFGGDYIGRHVITAIRQPSVLEAIELVLKGQGEAHASYLGREGSRDTSYDIIVRAVGKNALVSLIDRTEAEAIGRMRSDFIANVSHELRTPLTALMGFIDTLQGAARDDATARDRFLTIMAQEADRMTRLVDELMTLSRLEGSERQRPATQVSLGAVLTSAQAALMPIAKAAKIKLEVNIGAVDVVVTGDASQLQQVATNLIENAIKYGSKSGKIIVTLGRIAEQPQLRGQGVTLTVQDFGCGIASHHIPRLTERFYRVDSHRSREVGGTGLGLAIVKHIVNRHGGKLEIKSEISRGTTVSVILPL